MSVAVHHGNCIDIIPTLGVTVDAVVTDPPYDLVAMTKRFGGGQVAAKSPDHQRFARGFMNQTWDGTGVAFDPETWRVIGGALRPGGFLVAFGGTRTYHKMATAIEAAGFTIQDCLMFMFATGFPKRRDMLKPAYEPIVLAYKPGGNRTMQIDECRVSGAFESGWSKSGSRASENIAMSGANYERSPKPDSALGRWPANICHDGSDEVIDLFPESKFIGHNPAHRRRGFWVDKPDQQLPESYTDSGSAARFFFSAKAGAQDRWGSRHPTVKPVELMKWLVSLVTPIGGTCLDPFAGSGTTAVAALATGRNAILIEQSADYVADIRERLAFYEGDGRHSLASKARRRAPEALGGLFATATASDDLGSRSNTGSHPEYDETADAVGSYNDAIKTIGERVKAGDPVPTGGYFGGGDAGPGKAGT